MLGMYMTVEKNGNWMYNGREVSEMRERGGCGRGRSKEKDKQERASRRKE